MENNKLRILLAEDDMNLGNVLKAYLELKGFDVDYCGDGEEAYNVFLKKKFDFCIVDVMMPKKDGISLVESIRANDTKVPVIFLTAKSSEQDKLKGFMAGGDDYITKPFSMDELMARMEAIIRRSANSVISKSDKYEIGKYSFDYKRQTLTFGDETQKLTTKEAELLKLLCEFKNKTVERAFALNRIWKSENYFNSRSMDVYITKIRKYLQNDPQVQLVNIHGVGFKLVAE